MFRKSLWVVVGGLLMTALVFSCGDDDTTAPAPTPSPYQDLSQPDHVLVNLELAVDARDYDEYRRLIDPEFVFVFSPDDYGQGKTPALWGRADELPAVANLFDPAIPYPVKSIYLSLQYQEDDWTEVTPTGALYGGETWYQRAVTYRFTVQAAPDLIYVGNDIKAQITIRQEGGTWRIVEWRDEPQTTRSKSEGTAWSAAGSGGPGADGAIADLTWGRVKALYAGKPGYQDLTCRDDVLVNLELAYPSFNQPEYDRLLDGDDFIFFFGEGVGGEFTQYTKQQELQTLGNMADDTRPDRILSFYLQLSYPKCAWTAIVPTDPKYAGETWYQKTVSYRLIVQAAPDMTYIGNDIRAVFTIRRVKDIDGTTDVWRIVRWRDDLEGFVLQSGSYGDAAVQETSWGDIKALYN
jgi:hypothetical protein